NVVRNFMLHEFVVPLRAAEIYGNRLIVLCIQKRVSRVSRNRQRDGYRYNPDSVHAHTTILNGDGLTMPARIFSVSPDEISRSACEAGSISRPACPRPRHRVLARALKLLGDGDVGFTNYRERLR